MNAEINQFNIKKKKTHPYFWEGMKRYEGVQVFIQ